MATKDSAAAPSRQDPVRLVLGRIELRERQLVEQADELAARLLELDAEREALQVTDKTLRAMAADLQLEGPPAPALPTSRSWASSTTNAERCAPAAYAWADTVAA